MLRPGARAAWRLVRSVRSGLLKEFQGCGTLLRAFYYTAIIEDQEYSSIRPLIDWLDYRWVKIKNPDSPAMQRVRDGTL
jgi:hypothetical protein